MTDEKKIQFADMAIKFVCDLSTSEDIPVMVGTLNKANGIVGFKPAEIGHPVFHFKDRYIIYLERNDGSATCAIPYYNGSLSKFIDFIKK